MPKKRIRNIVTGNKGVTALLNYCDHNDLIFQAEPREDYGIDCYIEAQIGDEPQNFIVAVQVKSGPSYRIAESGSEFSIRIKRDDALYWFAANVPVLFIYFHDDENELYFKHIQDSFLSIKRIEECRKLSFSNADRASDGRLACYIRRLALGAPNMIDRLEVMAETPTLVDGKTRLQIKPFPRGPRVSFSELRHTKSSESPAGLPQYSQVVGYSADGTHVCELRYKGSGGADGFSVEYRFTNIAQHTYFEIPLVSSKDPEVSPFDEESFDPEAYDRTLIRLELVVNSLQVERPIVLFRDDEGAYGHQRPVEIAFGRRNFTVNIGQKGARDALLLADRSFFPPREAPLLLERIEPAWVPLPDDLDALEHLQSLEVARRFNRISAIWCNTSATILSFAIETNEENACWGSPAVHMAHFETSEVTSACAAALRH